MHVCLVISRCFADVTDIGQTFTTAQTAVLVQPFCSKLLTVLPDTHHATSHEVLPLPGAVLPMVSSVSATDPENHI